MWVGVVRVGVYMYVCMGWRGRCLYPRAVLGHHGWTKGRLEERVEGISGENEAVIPLRFIK